MSPQAVLEPVSTTRMRGGAFGRLHLWGKLLWPALALAILLAVDGICIRGFFSVSIVQGRLTGTLVDIFRYGAPAMVLSVGMTFVLATGGVDLSVGAIMALAGAIAAKAAMPVSLNGMGMSPGAGIAIALLVSVLAGMWNGMSVAWLGMQPIVATLVLMVAGRGIARLCIGAANVPLSGVIWTALHNPHLTLPTAPVIVLVVAIVAGLLTRATSIGLFIEALGGNPVASRYAGVRVGLITFMVYVFCGLCAGIAGMISSADVMIANASSTGMYMELDAILAVVIGGTALTGGRFSLVGSLIGALLIQTLQTTLIYKVPIQQTLVIKAIVVLAVCLLQSAEFRRKSIAVCARIGLSRTRKAAAQVAS